jgi:hypothetical protein
MRIMAPMTMLALQTIAGYPAENRDANHTITVHVEAGPSASIVTLMRAQAIASEIFIAVGVRLNWQTGQPKPHEMKQAIIIEITSNTPESFHERTLAYAKAFEGVHIRVFYDRLQRIVESSLLPVLLGHVLVHEITHILERTNNHSPEGIMKARWTTKDFLQMSPRRLCFDPSDVKLIQLGLADRDRALTTVLFARDTAPEATPAQ